MTTRPGYIWSGTEWVSIGQEAVVAPVSYQTSAPSTPSTGDIWIDSNDDVPGIDTSQFLRWRKTMSGGETSVSGTDDNGLTLQYTANYEQVYLNGVLLVRGQDYTATNGTSITGLTALAANDVVEVFGVVAKVVGDVYTQAQTNSLLDAKSNVSTTGLVLITSYDFTSQNTSISIDNCFSSNYRNYRILLDYKGDSAATGLQIRLRTTSDDSNSVYDRQEFLTTGTTLLGTRSQAQTSWVLSGGNRLFATATIDFFAPNLSSPTRMVSYVGMAETNWTDSVTTQAYGEHRNNYQATGFTLLVPVASTGTIKVYGYK